MSGHDHANNLPRGTVLGAGLMVLFSLAAVSAVRVAHIPPAASPEAMRAQAHIGAVKSRNLRFIDRADGAVLIEDADRGRVASIIPPGQQTGFIRGVMRGLARERRSHGIGDGPPFRLTMWQDGELSLTDSATGRSIEITAFGSTNRESFALLLAEKEPTA